MLCKRIPYFTAGDIQSKAKYHISMGHQTAIGQVTFFSCPSELGDQSGSFNKNNLIARNSQILFDPKKVYMAEEILPRQHPSQPQPKEESKDPQQLEAKDYYAIIKMEKEVLA